MEEENHNEKREDNFESNNFNEEVKTANEDVGEKVEEKKFEEKVEKESPIVSMGSTSNNTSNIKVKEEQQLTKKIRENPWMLSTLVLGAIVLVLLFLGNSSNLTGNVVSEDVVGQNLIDYLNTMPSVTSELTLVSVEDGDGNMYLVIVEYEGEEIPVYVTKDGEYYTPSLIPMIEEDIVASGATQSAEVVKSDNPVTELFIMTHCPYGTQAEKGLIPTIKALGDAADVKIRFVHYFMHEPEEEETLRQVCIREEQSDKFIPYLECFLEDGDSERCLTEVSVDVIAMDECISNGNAEKYYAEDSELSELYGVSGSPTLVVNGVIANSGRDSQSYLNTICSSFNSVPEVCVTAEVSSSSPSPMWGWDASGTATTASC